MSDNSSIEAALTTWFANRIWDRAVVTLNGDDYIVPASDDVPAINDTDMVLRGPDDALWDIDIVVRATLRPVPAHTGGTA